MVIGRSETERCQRQQDLLKQAELEAEETDGES
jgi:hypothetical protein